MNFYIFKMTCANITCIIYWMLLLRACRNCERGKRSNSMPASLELLLHRIAQALAPFARTTHIYSRKCVYYELIFSSLCDLPLLRHCVCVRVYSTPMDFWVLCIVQHSLCDAHRSLFNGKNVQIV